MWTAESFSASGLSGLGEQDLAAPWQAGEGLRLRFCAASEAAVCTFSLVGVFVCTVAVEKAPINLSQVMLASSLLEEASAPMYLTNDRLRDRGEIIGSFHLLSAEQGAMSLVASRGQQPLVIASPAGREKFHFAFDSSS